MKSNTAEIKEETGAFITIDSKIKDFIEFFSISKTSIIDSILPLYDQLMNIAWRTVKLKKTRKASNTS